MSPAGEPLAAGGFSTWLDAMAGALRGERAADVPCDGCTACCRSAQFVHIGPEEHVTLAHIPAELLFPAPRLPAGHVVLGYDENGCCPMLTDGGCSIYEYRPRACRRYDCRVFPATGLEPDVEGGPLLERARRWRFAYPDDADRAEHEALRATARYLEEHPEELPTGVPPGNRTQLAAAAIELRGRARRN